MNTNVSYSSKITDIMLWTIQAIDHFLLAIELLVTLCIVIRKKMYRFETQTYTFSIFYSRKKIDRREY